MRVVLDVVGKSVRGLAEQDTKGLYGETQKLARAFGDLEKAAGNKIFADNAGDLKIFTRLIEAAAHGVEHLNFSMKDILLSVTPFGAINQVLKGTAAVVSAVTADRGGGRFASGKIRGLEEAQKASEDADAKRGAAAAQQEQIDERAYERFKKLTKQRADLGVNAFLEETQAQKSALDTQQQNLDDAYGHQRATIVNFFSEAKRLAEQQANVQLAVLGKSGQAQEAIISRPDIFSEDERLGARQRLDAIAAQQQQTRFELQRKLVDLGFRERDAQRAYNDELTKSGIRLLELNQQNERAVEASFRLQNRPLFDYIAAARTNGTPDEKKQADALAINLNTELQILKTRARYNDELERGANLLDAISNEAQRIDLKVRGGQITSIDALNQQSALNRRNLADLSEHAERLKEIALTSGDPKLLAQYDAFRTKIEELAASVDLLANKFRDTFSSAFGDAFASFATGAKGARDIVRDLERSLVGSVSNLAGKNIGEALFNKGGPLGGVPDFFSSLFGGGNAKLDGAATLLPAGTALTASAAALSGAAAALTAAAAAQSTSSVVSDAGGFSKAFDLFSGFGFAAGGDPPVGRISVVGERGPELFVPKTAGTIVPNHVLTGRRNERAQASHTVNISVNVPGNTSRASADQIALTTGRHVQRALARLG
jgi:hypothetical protein